MKAKRKKVIIIPAVLLALVIVGYWYLFMGSEIPDASGEVIVEAEGSDSLIVYFTRMGETKGNMDAVSFATMNSNSDLEVSDTEAAALMIQELTGADMYQIKTARYYRDSFMGTAATSLFEETFDMRPELAAWPRSLEKYNIIYVGYPKLYPTV